MFQVWQLCVRSLPFLQHGVTASFGVQWGTSQRIVPPSSVSATTAASQDTSPRRVPSPARSQRNNATRVAA